MTLALLIAAVVIATLFLVFKWRRTGGILYALSVALFLAVGCGVVPQWLLQRLQAPYLARPAIEWGDRDVIVLLGAGAEKIGESASVEPAVFAYPRILEAGQLYHDCRRATAHCKLVVSGGDARNTGVAEASVYQGMLTDIGVDIDDIVLESKSLNTYQNAQLTSDILASLDAQRVLLVTSGIHLARSVLYFTHFGVPTTPVRADHLSARISILPNAYNFAVTDFALNEYIGFVRYRLYNKFGWNSRPKLHYKA